MMHFSKIKHKKEENYNLTSISKARNQVMTNKHYFESYIWTKVSQRYQSIKGGLN
jgi:hypothetical protein